MKRRRSKVSMRRTELVADIENLEARSDVNKVTKGAERRWGND